MRCLTYSEKSARWWFQSIFLFSPLFGEDSHFNSKFSIGLVQPPSRLSPTASAKTHQDFPDFILPVAPTLSPFEATPVRMWHTAGVESEWFFESRSYGSCRLFRWSDGIEMGGSSLFLVVSFVVFGLCFVVSYDGGNVFFERNIMFDEMEKRVCKAGDQRIERDYGRNSWMKQQHTRKYFCRYTWSGRWFEICCMFIPILGNDPIWLIIFRSVETTNQCFFLLVCIYIVSPCLKFLALQADELREFFLCIFSIYIYTIYIYIYIYTWTLQRVPNLW